MGCWPCRRAGTGGRQAGRSAAWPARAGGRPLPADRQGGAGDLQDLARRTGQRVDEVLARTATAGQALARSIGEARRWPRRPAARRGARRPGKLRAAQRLEALAERCQRVASQIQQRGRGEQISDRLVSLSDPDARPIRKSKPGKPNEFGYLAQIAQGHRQHRRGTRGYVLPAASLPGNPGENRLLEQTAAELDRLGDPGLRPGHPRLHTT